ncbi:MAG: hypothetical protein KBG25_07250 [Paludibacteraceae bacterium]|nr:hypothetical protein [Paludibacteraceae bacterium]
MLPITSNRSNNSLQINNMDKDSITTFVPLSYSQSFAESAMIASIGNVNSLSR